MSENINEMNEVIENTAEETLNGMQNLNAKDVAITLGLGTVVVGTIVLVIKAIKDKKFQFKNPFAKKSKLEEVVDNATDVIEEVVQD